MQTTTEHDRQIAAITFAAVYPHYIAKIEKKGRTKAELHTVIQWLTGFSDTQIAHLLHTKVTFAEFFQEAKLHANASLITGIICGYKIQDIQNPLTQKIRYLDKLVDELAKGKKMEKILKQV